MLSRGDGKHAVLEIGLAGVGIDFVGELDLALEGFVATLAQQEG